MTVLAPPAADATRRSLFGEIPIQYGLAGLTVMLVAAPLAPIILQAFSDKPLYDNGAFTFANFSRLTGFPGFWQMALNTLLFGLIATFVAQVIGTAAAILIGRTDLPLRRLLGEVFLWPLYVSSLILAFAWATIYGPSGYVTQVAMLATGGMPWDLYTLWGMSLVAGVSLAPVSFIYGQAAAASTDPTFEEAARIAGAGRVSTLVNVTLPLMKPSLFFSSILIFTSSLEMLSIPLVFGTPSGVKVFSTFLYERIGNAAIPDYGVAATAALVLVVVIVGLIALQSRVLGATRKYVTIGGKSVRPRPFPLGPFRWPVFTVVVAYVLLAVCLPLGILVLRGFVTFLHPMAPLADVLTLDNFRVLAEFPSYARSIWNSLFIAGVGGLIATAFITLVAIVVHRSEFRFRRPLLYVALMPRAIPGLIAGIGFFYAVAMIPGLAPLRSTVWILMIAFTMAAIPLGYGAIAPMLLKIGPELDQAARVQGASWWRSITRVVLPLLKPAIVACFALLFINFFKEYSTAVFLYAPGSEVIGTTLLQFWTQGHLGYVAALSTVQVAIIAFCIALARSVFGVKIYG
ncbi:ABC transporter permease [Falsirhodobacter sp. 20TX0035]|uniref:ABC transporter permease n=1 Tax=Falsirhodobacter sp. 20TX0035 TaxID=3022019 RepID=UPI00232F79ED|nr:iron ABC transporter permease [Falsirhodobacter sp. 20TX0035]MDB6454929.1 iron ABC transporter permease [Falsirhodobacter sp. 20TX0035]